MAEALGTASAVLQIADVAAKSAFQLYEFIITIKNAPQEIRSINRDIQNVQILLQNLKDSLESPAVRELVDEDPQLNRALYTLQDPMENCTTIFVRVTHKLRSHLDMEKPEHQNDTPGSRNRQERRSKWGSVKWYFKRKEVYSLVSDLERAKSTFIEAMGGVTLILTLRTSAVITKDPDSVMIPGKHRFDDNAGLALDQLSTAVEAELEHQSAVSEMVDRISIISVPQTAKSHDPKQVEDFHSAVALRSTFLVDVLLNHVDVNAQDADGRTALSKVAEVGDTPMAKLLLSRGASTSIRQYSNCSFFASGRTPLIWAARTGQSAMVELLLQYGANPNSRSTAGRTALQEACMFDHRRSIELLLDAGANVNTQSYNHGWAPIHEVVVNNHIDLLKIFLAYSPSLDPPTAEMNHGGKAPLHFAVCNRNMDIVNLLISHGADPNVLMLEEITPLHLAASAGWADGMNRLVECGASINARDALHRETPLHKAARNLEVVATEILCQLGADNRLENIDGQDYQSIVACAQKSPDDWRVAPYLAPYMSMDRC